MSTIQANAILDASGGNTTTINGVTPNTDSVRGRNIIINGAMNVAQRGTSGFTAGNTYGLDRWKNWADGSGAFTVEQSTDVPTTEPFQYSLKSTVTTSSTPSGGDYYGVAQYIEGNNTHSLGFGTSAAKTITLSFWVKSSVAGTYTVAISNQDGATRTYGADYSISSANTWEKKSLTISGDTTGTWAKGNTNGLRVWFALGMGSTYSTSASNSWESSAGIQTPSAIDWIANAGATFYITGVKLEVGSVATEFDHRSYGEELALCQRYYYSNINISNQRVQFDTYVTSGIYPIINLTHPTTMRTAPTLTKIGTWTGSNIDQSTLSFAANKTSVRLQADANGTGRGYLYPNVDGGFSCDAEL